MSPTQSPLADAGGYLIAIVRHEPSGQLDYQIRSHLKKLLQTVAMRIDRFHTFWRGSQRSAKQLATTLQTSLYPRSGESSA